MANTTRPCRLLIGSCILGGVLGASATAGEPYIPEASDSVVAELTRAPWAAPKASDAERLRGDTPRSAAAYALQQLQRARRGGDARYIGYAQAALSPWLGESPRATEILLPLALAQQARHEFSVALHTLDELIDRKPTTAQAWLSRAVILQVQGKPQAAEASCRRLPTHVSRLIKTTCMAGAQRQGPLTRRAFHQLQRAIDDASVADLDHLPWSLSVLAELAEALDDGATAESALEAALRLDPNDVRPRIAYVDLLLRKNQPNRVLTAIPETRPTPQLLLRKALAAKALGHPQAITYIASLRAHFAAASRRGDDLHQREAALAHLRLFADPEKALALATANWRKQREFADTWTLLEAARAAGDRHTLHRVQRWLESRKIKDARLTPLIGAISTGEADHAS